MAKSGSPFVDLLMTLSLQILILAGSAQAQNVSFLVSGQFGAGPDPVSVTVGDFNGDGIQDLAVANHETYDGPDGISVLLGNGDGTFQEAINFGSGGNVASFVAVGDFNGDGVQDLVVANSGDFDSGNVSVLLGNGDGTLQTARSLGAGSNPFSVAVGDFNGDGVQDLAITNGGSAHVSVLLGNGDGTFQAAVNFGVGIRPAVVTVGDFNGDGIQDLAVANNGSNNLSVLLGNGDGTFQVAVNFGAGGSPLSVAVADFNGDGVQDLAVANEGSNNVSVLLGNGDGTFQAAVNFGAGVNPISVAVGDFNGDGRPDLAVANDFFGIDPGLVTVLINNTQ